MATIIATIITITQRATNMVANQPNMAGIMIRTSSAQKATSTSLVTVWPRKKNSPLHLINKEARSTQTETRKTIATPITSRSASRCPTTEQLWRNTGRMALRQPRYSQRTSLPSRARTVEIRSLRSLRNSTIKQLKPQQLLPVRSRIKQSPIFQRSSQIKLRNLKSFRPHQVSIMLPRITTSSTSSHCPSDSRLLRSSRRQIATKVYYKQPSSKTTRI